MDVVANWYHFIFLTSQNQPGKSFLRVLPEIVFGLLPLATYQRKKVVLWVGLPPIEI
jgi:hypothetical protein